MKVVIHLTTKVTEEWQEVMRETGLGVYLQIRINDEPFYQTTIFRGYYMRDALVRAIKSTISCRSNRRMELPDEFIDTCLPKKLPTRFPAEIDVSDLFTMLELMK